MKSGHGKKNRRIAKLNKKNKKYLINKQTAFQLIWQKINYFGLIYDIWPKKIFIKNQKTRWGSCSKKGNLNFNYKIVLIPEHLTNYIIVHELCHLREFNHSKYFWDLVAKTIPDWKKIRQEFKKISIN